MDYTESKIKCAPGIKMNGEMIMLIDKGNKHSVCPACYVLDT